MNRCSRKSLFRIEYENFKDRGCAIHSSGHEADREHCLEVERLATVQTALTAVREALDEYGPEWVGAAIRSWPNLAPFSI